MNNINERQEEFWFTLIREGDLRKTWKPQIEIIFMLKGTGRIYFADIKTMYTVQKEDIFVINRFEVHHLGLEENAVALSFFGIFKIYLCHVSGDVKIFDKLSFFFA